MIFYTPFIEEHRSLSAKMVNFHGWKLPLEFSGSTQEHLNVRKHVGLFDVSHMGQIRITGHKALHTLEKLFTNNSSALQKNQAQYTLLCNEKGGILDDLILYCLKPQEDYLLCVNASRCAFDTNWILQNNPYSKVQVKNETLNWAQLALQGPQSDLLLAQLLHQKDLLHMKKLTFHWYPFRKEQILVSATGYTGEKGFEILIPKSVAVSFWRDLLTQGKDFSCLPTGLAARDTLRIEMKYPLYGNDLNEDKDPYSAGLGWTVKNSSNFIGSKALSFLREQKPQQKWIGFKLEKKAGVPRQGQAIYFQNTPIGEVTSGAKSPCLHQMIGMGYVQQKYSSPGQKLHIAIHQNLIPAEVVATPFIKQ